MTDFPTVIRRQASTRAHRPATEEDRRFIVSAWSASYKDSHSAGMIGTERWAPV